MEQHLGSFEGRRDVLDAAVLQVELMELVAARHALEVLQPAAAQIVNHRYVRAASDERFDQMAPDETRATGHGDPTASPCFSVQHPGI